MTLEISKSQPNDIINQSEEMHKNLITGTITYIIVVKKTTLEISKMQANDRQLTNRQIVTHNDYK